MRISAGTLTVVLGLTTLATIVSPAGADMKPAGVVTTLNGTATIARASLPEGAPLKRLDGVFLADRVTTHADSLARILLGGKALVTVRERSVLTITEVPGRATVEVGPGGVALAVVKERMRSGESIEIRTPNAVAGVRGTVVIAEVEQATAELGNASAAFTTTFTVLRGVVQVHSLDPLSGRLAGAGVRLGALQTLRVTGGAPPGPPQPVPAERVRQLVAEYRTRVAEAPPTANAAIVEDQLRDATSRAVDETSWPGGPHPVAGALFGSGPLPTAPTSAATTEASSAVITPTAPALVPTVSSTLSPILSAPLSETLDILDPVLKK